MVPGKTNISLTFGWSAAYDPVAAAEQEGTGTQSVPCSPAHRYADSAASDSFTGADMLERRPSRSQPGTSSPRGSIDVRVRWLVAACSAALQACCESVLST